MSSDVYVRRQREQHLRDSYRVRARELYAESAVTHDPHMVLRSITVPEHANVQSGEDGAFVEAVVWVPKSQVSTLIKGFEPLVKKP